MALEGGSVGKSYRRPWTTRHKSVEEVLKRGADPNCPSDDEFLLGLNLGRIPILFVAICGSSSVCCQMLRGATGWMHRAYEDFLQRENVKNVQLLLKYGADPNTHISDKTSALHLTVSLCTSMGKPYIVRELIKYGADANAIGPHRQTPLHMALCRNKCPFSHSPCKTTIKALLQAPGIDLNLRGENGCTPLSIAASVTRATSAWFVKEVLISIPKTLTGKRHFIARNFAVAELLLSQSHINPNLNPTYLPLFFAVSHNMTAMVERLLSTKATDPSRKDSNGRFALTLPTSGEIIRLLVQASAELDIPDSTALVTFIAQNYDTRSTLTRSATQSDNDNA
ncbi:hypothetical protein N7517_011299 [Penicillium concentricum]|uniref:Uncharacterized protein n=1 Tax=Penicillium concentricum TaxID=293559 RepID=A0A9W9RAI0_9EURO|nr:uncharacterized protein N7517_011299 [Penicillium concentricum]KAJ5356690.1 hypothetical protein N7517_011299 [Penicillium concentricum]